MKVCASCHRCFDDEVFSCTQPGHPDLSESRNEGCDQVPGYRLELLIESGLKGEIYLARQLESGVLCHLTILEVADAEREQFLQQARKAAAFLHPHVAGIYEVGRLESGEHFVVSEAPDGETLRDVLNEVGAPELLTSIEIARQTAEALDALHSAGLTHGAVNPDNIVLTKDSAQQMLIRLQNLDIAGITARSITSNKFLIDTALDSIKYFAPEQFAGETTQRSDIYSLGTVFYEMLAGSPPFDGSNAAAIIQKHREQSPPDISINNYDLRMLITHALRESLQKKAVYRQRTANTFARQLRHIEQLATHTPTPPPVMQAYAANASTQAANEPASNHQNAPAIFNDPSLSIFSKEAVEPASQIETSPSPVYQDLDRAIPIESGHIEIPHVIRRKKKSSPEAEVVPVSYEMEPVARPVIEHPPDLVREIATTLPEKFAPAEVADPQPRKIEWLAADDDIPTEAEVMRVIAKAPVEPYVHFEDSEMETTHEPQRFRVELEDALLAADATLPVPVDDRPDRAFQGFAFVSDAFASLPERISDTFVGLQERISATFSNPDRDPASTSTILYRGFMATGALAVVTLLFMIGIFVVGDNIVSGSSEHAAEGPATEAPAPAPPMQTVPEQEVAEQPAEAPEYSYTQPVETSFDRNDLSTVKTKPAPPPPVATDKTVADSPAKVSPPKPAAVAQPAKTKIADKPAIGTTVVITAKDGKVTSKIEPQKSANKKPASNTDKSVITRPRVVANPKP